MLHILTIIGARPQIIKAAALSRAVRSKYADTIQEKILHTGQHYDSNMSEVFFSELGIPQPDYNLHVGSGRHGEQTARMIIGIEQVLTSEHFDGVVVYGDTNSTLAGAVAASKLHIPVFHIEAGLRSFNMSMPEEINRMACDTLSSILFAPTETAMQNLRSEGYLDSKAVFPNGKQRVVSLSGDVMYDNSRYYARLAEERSKVLAEYQLTPNNYLLATIHRDHNTDDACRLTDIFRALLCVSEECGQPVALPLHPRTRKCMEQHLSSELFDYIISSPRICLLPPVSFLDMIALERNASLVLTDSGGVQKEAFFFEKPCVILRPETEWVEIVKHGAGILADADYDRIVAACRTLFGRTIHFPPLFGEGDAAERVLEEIIKYLRG